jgi:hypothetical protein
MKETSKSQGLGEGNAQASTNIEGQPKITLEKAKEALLRSGYVLEHRVENFLRHHDWYVETNSAYKDDETQKSRELDIFARKIHYFNSELYFEARIIAECINNPQPLAFITKEDKYSASYADDIKLQLSIDESLNSRADVQAGLPTFLGLCETHHYCKGRVSTQFCSFSKKKDKSGEWLASHEDSHFNCFMTLIKALEHQLKEPVLPFPGFLSGRIVYPILILQGDLLDIRVIDNNLTAESTSHIKHRRSVIWGGEEKGYIIDVITEQGLREFLPAISEEIDKAIKSIRQNAEILNEHAIPFTPAAKGN